MVAGAACGERRAEHALCLVEPHEIDPGGTGQRRRLHQGPIVGSSAPIVFRFFKYRLRISGTTALQLARRERQSATASLRPIAAPSESASADR